MLLAVALCLLPARHAAAEDTPFGELPVEVHAFVSQGFMVSTENNYLTHSRRGSFEFTEVGLNLTRSISDDLTVGMQLFMRDLGPIGNYEPKFDWFYLDYHFRDWLGLRAGRTKLPFGLYNDQSDIDAARVPVLLPQSVYPTADRDFLLAQTGFELYGYLRLPVLGALDYRAYGGTIFLDSTSLVTSPGATVTNIDVPYVAGARVLWHAPAPLDGLTLGGSYQMLRINLDLLLTPTLESELAAAGILASASSTFRYNLPVRLWVGSLEYSAHDLLLAAEYSQWHYELSTQPEIIPNENLTSARWYVMGSYRVTPRFSPGVYYSVLNTGVKGPDTRDKYQQDFALSNRYDLTANWLVKVEGHYMRGTAGLDSSLNSNVPLTALARNWTVFMVKTTAYF